MRREALSPPGIGGHWSKERSSPMTVTSRLLPLGNALSALLAIAVQAQQPNSVTASAIWGGVNGPPWPISVSAAAPGSLNYIVSGLPNQPFALAHAPAGLAAGRSEEHTSELQSLAYLVCR